MMREVKLVSPTSKQINKINKWMTVYNVSMPDKLCDLAVKNNNFIIYFLIFNHDLC